MYNDEWFIFCFHDTLREMVMGITAVEYFVETTTIHEMD